MLRTIREVIALAIVALVAPVVVVVCWVFLFWLRQESRGPLVAAVDAELLADDPGIDVDEVRA